MLLGGAYLSLVAQQNQRTLRSTCAPQPKTPKAQLLWQQHPLLASLENYVSVFGTEV